jgi:hypothetical protein
LSNPEKIAEIERSTMYATGTPLAGWYGEYSSFGIGNPIKGKTFAGKSLLVWHLASSTMDNNYRFLVRYATKSKELIKVYKDTGLIGGTEVIKRPEFKHIVSPGTSSIASFSINDTPLMNQFLSLASEFYKPVYGGQLSLDGLDTQIELLSKVSISNTDLPSIETNNLICYGINYNVSEKRTTVDLSNQVFFNLPYFNPVRERSMAQNEMLVKLGMLDSGENYKRI